MRLRHRAIFLACALWLISTAHAADQRPTISVDRAVHFTAPDGGDVQLTPGEYRVEPGGESHLRLIAQGGQPIQIAAAKTSHDETLFVPLAMGIIEEGQEDTLHLVLMLPDGQALDATGSYSGVRSRVAVVSVLKPAQLQTAISQAKVTPQPPPPQQTPPAPAFVRVPQASVGAASAAIKTPANVALGTGKWISWTYLQVNHPELVAQALVDVQSGKRPRSFVAGLATPADVNEMLKVNWAAEVAKFNAAAAMQAPVTTRGISPLLTTPPKPAPPPVLLATISALPVLLPARDLGAHYSGERPTTIITITAPADGYLETELDLNATRQRFRIVQVTSYTGELVNGVPVVAFQAKGGAYNDIRPKANDPKTNVSMAGFVGLDVRAGQRIDVEVAFEPDSIIGPPVGSYEVQLSIYYFEGSKWNRIVPIRAYCNGINFGVIAYAEQAHAATLTDRTVDYPIVITNAPATPAVVGIIPQQLPPGVTMDPIPNLSIPGHATQRYTLRFNVAGQTAQDGSAQPIVVTLNDYSGRPSRQLNLSMSIYHPWVFWCTGWASCDGAQGVPGQPNNRFVIWRLPNDDLIGVSQLQLWIKDDGQWWWKIDAFNENGPIGDIGGTTFVASINFVGNTSVSDGIVVHVGTETRHQFYEHTNANPWIQSNFLAAAETGVSFSVKKQ